ncbi:MAG: electron transfer flavoprotein subunit alpha/FixB family protein [Thermodesulfobacteriota bacterium]
MGEIFVIVEHRQGEIRDITWEMLHKARELCEAFSHQLTAVLLADEDAPFVDEVARWADRVILCQDSRLKAYNSDLYKEILSPLLKEERPYLTLIGHTPWGMDLAPALAVKTEFPLAADCVDVQLDGGKIAAIRQIYSGKMYARVGFKDADAYLITVRPSAFPPDRLKERSGEVIPKEIPADVPEPRQTFVEFVDTAAGEVDIAQADFLISVGRGVGDEEHIPELKELADTLGGVLSCSRPVVDKHWLPKFHQVGTSGKSVKPKVYLALGISGAFQHVAGISGAGTVIAVNKDKKAPIFQVADYGVVDDLFTISEALKEKSAG